MLKLGFTRCCGVLELDGISGPYTPQEIVLLVAKMTRPGRMVDVTNPDDPWYPLAPFITFTGVTMMGNQEGASNHARFLRVDNYGERLASFIEENGFGKVVRSEPRVSWSGNELMLWIWHLDYARLFEFADTQFPEEMVKKEEPQCQ